MVGRESERGVAPRPRVAEPPRTDVRSCPMSEPLLRDPRYQPHRVVGALLDGRAICASHVTPAGEDTRATVERIGELLEAHRLAWLTRTEALASGRVDCEQCGESLDGLG